MIYKDFQSEKLSLLGFGTMRLPTLSDKTIDEKATAEMVDVAISNGVNYFDTAWPYHGGNSELVVGKILSDYDRGSFNLATKYPGHQTMEKYDPAEIFEQQLKKCRVDYFDYYLLHNICENSIETYKSKKWGILEYFKEQKANGRIRHLGFSSHARAELLGEILEIFGEDMEFCQIQLNYLDYTLQNAKAKCDMLNSYGIPIWVMEPVRGGKLASLAPDAEAVLKSARPDESVPAWAFRWLQGVPGVTMILSGMSNMDQMKDNLKTFEVEKPLTAAEVEIILGIAEKMKNSLPCTACRYCVEGCPAGLDIPMMIAAYNDLRFAPGSYTVHMQMDSLTEDKLPSACIGCGACSRICPQGIDIPKAMSELAVEVAKFPKWAAICKERELANKKANAKP